MAAEHSSPRIRCLECLHMIFTKMDDISKVQSDRTKLLRLDNTLYFWFLLYFFIAKWSLFLQHPEVHGPRNNYHMQKTKDPANPKAWSHKCTKDQVIGRHRVPWSQIECRELWTQAHALGCVDTVTLLPAPDRRWQLTFHFTWFL